MSDPIAIISNINISSENFVDFLQNQNNVFVENMDAGEGRISKGHCHVWIYMSNDELQYYKSNDLFLIKHALGHKPQTLIILEISRTAGSEQLANDFIYQFLKKWPCIVDDLHGKIYSLKELQQAYQNERSIFGK